nr:MAG TPA: hypothetical protein [Caudoviricetes sp.]
MRPHEIQCLVIETHELVWQVASRVESHIDNVLPDARNLFFDVSRIHHLPQFLLPHRDRIRPHELCGLGETPTAQILGHRRPVKLNALSERSVILPNRHIGAQPRGIDLLVLLDIGLLLRVRRLDRRIQTAHGLRRHDVTLVIAIKTNGRRHETLETFNVSVQLFAGVFLDKALRLTRIVLSTRNINTVATVINLVQNTAGPERVITARRDLLNLLRRLALQPERLCSLLL